MQHERGKSNKQEKELRVAASRRTEKRCHINNNNSKKEKQKQKKYCIFCWKVMAVIARWGERRRDKIRLSNRPLSKHFYTSFVCIYVYIYAIYV